MVQIDPNIAFVTLLNQLAYLIGNCVAFGAQLTITDAHNRGFALKHGRRTANSASPKFLVGSYMDWTANSNLGVSIALIRGLSETMLATKQEDNFDISPDKAQFDYLRKHAVRLCIINYLRDQEQLKQYFPDFGFSIIYHKFSEALVHSLAGRHKPIEECELPEAAITLEW